MRETIFSPWSAAAVIVAHVNDKLDFLLQLARCSLVVRGLPEIRARARRFPIRFANAPHSFLSVWLN